MPAIVTAFRGDWKFQKESLHLERWQMAQFLPAYQSHALRVGVVLQTVVIMCYRRHRRQLIFAIKGTRARWCVTDVTRLEPISATFAGQLHLRADVAAMSLQHV